MKNKMKKFKIKVMMQCRSCGKKEQQLSSVKAWMVDVNHRYVGSGRSFVDVYSNKLCKKCFKSFTKQFKDIKI